MFLRPCRKIKFIQISCRDYIAGDIPFFISSTAFYTGIPASTWGFAIVARMQLLTYTTA
jgi:hypothetical protein